VKIRLNKNNLKTAVLYFFIFILIVFLFVGGESQQKHRLIKDIWDSGHLILFGLLSFSYFSRPRAASRTLFYKIIFTTLVCLVAGTGIELIQLFTHREFSRSDIVNDLIGGYLGLLTLLLINKQSSLKIKAVAFLFLIIFIALGLRNMGKHLTDEFVMRQQFPLLAGFETQLEMSRWDSNLTNIKRSTRFVKSGNYSLKVDFLPGRYPNISLKHFKNNWSGYHKLTYSVYNPSLQSLNFEMKVYDYQHTRTSRRYNDRFNQSVTLAPGWNTIETPLQAIISTPKNRSMNIHQIKGFSLFTDKLAQPVTVYIDDIHLS